MPLELGLVISDRYQITQFPDGKPFREGFYGYTYLAQDLRENCPVIVKELKPEHLPNEKTRKRFRQEARAGQKVSHSNVVKYQDVIWQENKDFLIMEYIQGGSLRDLLERVGGRVPIRKSLKIIRSVLDGLAAINEIGIIHRDLKPENVLLTKDGVPKISDFGVAHVPKPAGGYSCLTSDSELLALGTLKYMSPEQTMSVDERLEFMDSKELDKRSDPYTAGVMLYELLTRTFYIDVRKFKSEYHVVDAIRSIPPSLELLEWCKLGTWLAAVLRKALAKRPEARYQAAEEFRHCLADGVRYKINRARKTRPSAWKKKNTTARYQDEELILGTGDARMVTHGSANDQIYYSMLWLKTLEEETVVYICPACQESSLLVNVSMSAASHRRPLRPPCHMVFLAPPTLYLGGARCETCHVEFNSTEIDTLLGELIRSDVVMSEPLLGTP